MRQVGAVFFPPSAIRSHSAVAPFIVTRLHNGEVKIVFAVLAVVTVD